MWVTVSHRERSSSIVASVAVIEQEEGAAH